MRPQNLLEHIRQILIDESNLPSKTNFIDEEPATTAEHSGIKLPIVSIDIASVDDIDVFNTDYDEETLDGSGNIDTITYRAEYEMGLQIDLMTAAESQYDRDQLGTDIWNTLYKYVDEGPSDELHPSVWMFRIDDEDTVDDFTMTPTLRMWRLNCTVGGVTEFSDDVDAIAGYNLNEPTVN